METRLEARNDAVPARDTVAPCLGCPHTLINPDALAPELVAGYHQLQRACREHRQTLAAQGARFMDEAPLRIGDLTLNLRTRIATRGSVTEELPAREFAVLAVLMGSPGKIFRRKELVRAAWSDQLKPDTNAVAVTIARLRAKIDTGFETQLIQTVHWQGYRLNADG